MFNMFKSNGYHFYVLHDDIVAEKMTCKFKVLPQDYMKKYLIVGTCFEGIGTVTSCVINTTNIYSRYVSGTCIIDYKLSYIV